MFAGRAQAQAQQEPASQGQTPGQEQGQAQGQAQGQEHKAQSQAGTENCHESGTRVEFKKGSDLAGEERKKLDEVAAWLSADPKRTAVVKGSADPSGSAKMNEDLSFRRAETVATELATMGVAPARVVAVGEGEAPPNSGLTPQEQRSAVILLCSAPQAAAAEPAPAPSAPQVVETPPVTVPVPETPPEGPVAQAGEPGRTTEPYQEPAPLHETAPEHPSGLGGIGLGFSLGGGVIGFSDSQARDLAHTGGSWDARVIFGTRLPLALELAYVGSAQGIDAAGISSSSMLVGNGGEGNLRVQLPTFYVRPYIFGGLGWTHYQLVNTNGNNSLIATSDDLLTVPLGLGVTGRAPFGGTADLRGTFRLAYRETLMDGYYAGTGERADLHTWGVTARLGWEF
jgi:outer membrane protein OmpA-like peptidoglycan-associated protein